MIEIKKERQGLSFFIGGPEKPEKPKKRKKFTESIEIRGQIWYTD